jgi:hypothetical protein
MAADWLIINETTPSTQLSHCYRKKPEELLATRMFVRVLASGFLRSLMTTTAMMSSPQPSFPGLESQVGPTGIG